MKHLIAIILLSVVCAIPACADDYKIDAMSKDPVQLDVAIRFNAIEPGLAIKIMEHLKWFYGRDGETVKACKLDYTLSTPESSTTYVTIFEGNGFGMSFSNHQGGKPHTGTGEPCYDSREDAKAHCKGGYFDSGDEDGFRYCCLGRDLGFDEPKDSTGN